MGTQFCWIGELVYTESMILEGGNLGWGVGNPRANPPPPPLNETLIIIFIMIDGHHGMAESGCCDIVAYISQTILTI